MKERRRIRGPFDPMTRQAREVWEPNRHRRPPRAGGPPGGSCLCRTSPRLVDRRAQALAPRAGASSKPSWRGRIARLEVVRRDAAQPDPRASPRLDRDLREQVDRGVREHAAIAGRRAERGAPRDLAEVVVLDDQHDRARAQLGGAQPGGDPIGLVEQDHRELALVVEIVARTSRGGRPVTASRSETTGRASSPRASAARCWPVTWPSRPTSAASG